VSTIDRIAIRHVDVERATVISALPFAAVVSKVAAAIGHPDMSEFARAVRAARTSPDLEAVVTAAIGTAGLMEMAHFDVGEVLRKEAEDAPEALRLVVGKSSDYEGDGQTRSRCRVVCAGDDFDRPAARRRLSVVRPRRELARAVRE
jgi:hypothetical protein